MTYYVFAGSNYYPSGGMEDYLGMADTLEEAKALAVERVAQKIPQNRELFNISRPLHPNPAKTPHFRQPNCKICPPPLFALATLSPSGDPK